jgi:hypothetical protein
MNSLDRFCLNGLAVVVAGVVGMLAMAASPAPAVSKPVVLHSAKLDKCGDDWLCVLAAEREVKKPAKAEARQPKGRGHGYSEKERKELNQLIARLP